MAAYSNIILPTRPEDLKKIRGAMDEISNSMTRMEAERDLVKEIKLNLKEDHQLPLKLISMMAKTYHKSNYSEEQSQFEDFELLYETVNGSPKDE